VGENNQIKLFWNSPESLADHIFAFSLSWASDNDLMRLHTQTPLWWQNSTERLSVCFTTFSKSKRSNREPHWTVLITRIKKWHSPESLTKKNGPYLL